MTDALMLVQIVGVIARRPGVQVPDVDAAECVLELAAVLLASQPGLPDADYRALLLEAAARVQPT
jgi:hypothetical protein